MQHPRFLQILTRMDSLIRYQCTGKPSTFAGKLNISERSLFNYLAWMKSLGAPIRYSHSRESYIYMVEGSFLIGFVRSTMRVYAA